MQSNITSVQFTPEIVLGNLNIFATFEEGDKPLLDFSTGAITKETRSFAYLRRKLGGFDPKAVERTFREAENLIKSTAELHQRKVVTLNKDSISLKIYGQFLKAIGGVKTMAETYRDAGGATVADQLDAVAMVYFAKFSELPSLQELADSPRTTLRRRLKKSATPDNPLPAPSSSPAPSAGDSMKAPLLTTEEREPSIDTDTASKEEASDEDSSNSSEHPVPHPSEVRIQMDPQAVEPLQVADKPDEMRKGKGKGIIYKILGCCLKG